MSVRTIGSTTIIAQKPVSVKGAFACTLGNERTELYQKAKIVLLDGDIIRVQWHEATIGAVEGKWRVLHQLPEFARRWCNVTDIRIGEADYQRLLAKARKAA